MHGMTSEFAATRDQINRRLGELVPSESTPPERLHQSVRYTLLAHGKRIRPLVTMMTNAHLGGNQVLAIDPACAIEMVHCASLIIDDMPAMDDAKLRRGRPANHVVFGEDTATLAAFALLNRAYEVVAESPGLSDTDRVELVKTMAASIGTSGIIGGQESDLHFESADERNALVRMHEQKTGALFVASAFIGARLAQVSEQELELIGQYASKIGLAFQMLDDLLDFTSTEARTGKDVDQDLDKTTFVSILGVEETRLQASQAIEFSIQALDRLGTVAGPLKELAHCLLEACQTSASAATPVKLAL